MVFSLTHKSLLELATAQQVLEAENDNLNHAPTNVLSAKSEHIPNSELK